MKLLLSADWQADWDNLDLCHRASQEVLKLCDSNAVDAFAVVGDLKRQYNPIDTRVVLFWTDFINRLSNRTKVIVVLGNHDRVGMYSEAQNWLPILEHAGATVVHNKPKRITIGSGALYCLPFSSSIDETKKWANDLVQMHMTGESSRILLFHNDLLGCSYNVLEQPSQAKLRPKDLYPGYYDYCFGGHVHLRQKLGENISYIGNPFASDWGEANQKKGYTLVDGDTWRVCLSTIPGWYDPSWPRFPKEKENWKGTRVRIHVKINAGQNYTQAIDKARQEAEKKYAGATVYAVPEFEESETATIKVKLSDTDAVKIKTYVDETLPEFLERRRAQIITYLLYRLEDASHGLSTRSAGRIEILGFKARRFLSFNELELDFKKPGIWLIVGKNQDWNGRSNGAGKTNLLQPIPVAWFGSTFKGQKHDSWAMRDTHKPAFVSVSSRDAKDRIIRVERGRRPGKLQLFVDGKEQSSGLQSTSKTGTQGLIERVTGFTWQTLANSVYIDQQQVNTFLSGTPAEQKKILERFQNLERFAKALEKVVESSHKEVEALRDAESEKAIASERVKAFKEMLDKEEPDDDTYASAKKHLEQAQAKYQKKVSVDIVALAKKLKLYKVRHEELRDRWEVLSNTVSELQGKRKFLSSKVEDITNLLGESKCPTCEQEINEQNLSTHVKELEGKSKQVTRQLERIKESLVQVADEKHAYYEKVRSTEEVIDKYNDTKDEAQSEIVRWHHIVDSTKAQVLKAKERKRSLERRISAAEHNVKFWQKQIILLTEEKAVADYCVKAFSRDGLPAFLNAQICPALNKAAAQYSEVFTDKEIQVRFSMNEADFQVEVVNAHGGKDIQDQSTGERKMAAIIASFALRAVAPPCNLLVLDEPGDGLDAVNAKAFATGLRKLKSQFGVVLLTSHNPTIVGELSGENHIVVEKEDGVSTIL